MTDEMRDNLRVAIGCILLIVTLCAVAAWRFPAPANVGPPTPTTQPGIVLVQHCDIDATPHCGPATSNTTGGAR